MVPVARSTAKVTNPEFTEFARQPGEGNLDWGNRAARHVGQFDPSMWSYLVLLGASDTLGFRLRLAQSHLRPDMLPSYWSEALLVDLNGADLKKAKAIHVPLTQPGAPGYPPFENGVVKVPLLGFDDPTRYPNIAIAALPIPQVKLRAQIQRFRRSRPMLDALEHVLRWLSFSWGVAGTGNPLHESFGLPSACMIEMVCAAEGYELTPGLESRASCPEAIWASLRHWHEYYAEIGEKRIPRGRYSTEHSYEIRSPSDPKDEAQKPKAPKRRGTQTTKK